MPRIGAERTADSRHNSDYDPHPTAGTKPVKLSARNKIKGVIKSVTKGQTTAHVQIEIGGVIVSASITNEAVDELKLTSGQTAYAVIKASDVMVGVD